MCRARIILIMGSCMLFYLLTSQSWYVRDNVYGKYLKAFRVFFLGAFVTVVVDTSASVLGVVAPKEEDKLLLDKPWYFALNVATQLAYALHFVGSTWSTGQVLQRHHWQLQPLY